MDCGLDVVAAVSSSPVGVGFVEVVVVGAAVAAHVASAEAVVEVGGGEGEACVGSCSAV